MEPLQGIRIVELTTNVAAPMGTQLLADQGADVIRIEAPGAGGDPARAVGAVRNGVTSYYLALNRNKRALAMDLKDTRSRPLMADLLQSADVFVHNTRPGVVERLGYGYEAVHAINPELIYVSLSGFGPDGPGAGNRVYDLVVQAVSGMARVQAGAQGPEFVRNIVCDKVSALTLAQAVTAALLARARGAGGHHVELTMLEACLNFLWPDGFWNHSFVGDCDTKPLISEFVSTVATADGHAALFTVGDHEFAGACAVFDAPELHEDPRFRTLADRFANAHEMMAEFKARARRFTTAELVARMEAAEVPCAKVNDFEDVLADPRVVHRGSLVEYDHPQGGRVRQPRPAAIFGREPCAIRRPAPALGEHTDEVFTALGHTPERLAELRRAGVLG